MFERKKAFNAAYPEQNNSKSNAAQTEMGAASVLSSFQLKNTLVQNNCEDNTSGQPAILLQGEIIYIDKRKEGYVTKIETPSVQTCILISLNSPEAMAVAHIDTNLVASETIDEMVFNLKAMGATNIKAETVGGDFYVLTQKSTSVIFNEIEQALKKNGIQRSNHDFYTTQVPKVILPLTYLALRTARTVGPESYLFVAICTVIACCCSYALNYLLEKSFDVTVNTKDGKIKVITNDEENSVRIMTQATQTQRDCLFARSNIDLKNPRNAEVLKLNIIHK